MAIKKAQLYAKLWAACDELRGGMDASQYKDYVLVVLFIKYLSDKKKSGDDSLFIDLPEGCSFDDLDFSNNRAADDDLIGDAYDRLLPSVERFLRNHLPALLTPFSR